MVDNLFNLCLLGNAQRELTVQRSLHIDITAVSQTGLATWKGLSTLVWCCASARCTSTTEQLFIWNARESHLAWQGTLAFTSSLVSLERSQAWDHWPEGQRRVSGTSSAGHLTSSKATWATYTAATCHRLAQVRSLPTLLLTFPTMAKARSVSDIPPSNFAALIGLATCLRPVRSASLYLQ